MRQAIRFSESGGRYMTCRPIFCLRLRPILNIIEWTTKPFRPGQGTYHLAPVGQLSDLPIQLNGAWKNHYTFFSNLDISWTNNGTEHIIGQMKICAWTMQGYKFWPGSKLAWCWLKKNLIEVVRFMKNCLSYQFLKSARRWRYRLIRNCLRNCLLYLRMENATILLDELFH